MPELDQTIQVFIADASRDSVELLCALFEPEDDISVVGTALRGDEALRSIPDSGADLLLVDLLLPGLDGLSLLRRLKQAGDLPHAIVLSGFYNDSIARCVSAVADNFLPKPCGGEDLLRHIRAAARGTESGLVRDDGAVVRRALMEVCVLPHLDGFRYLQSALQRTWANPAQLRGVTKSLYRDVAKEFGTTPACVERSVRSAIERAWQRMDAATRQRVFGTQAAASEKAPSNVPFLTAMTVFLDDHDGGGYRSGGR